MWCGVHGALRPPLLCRRLFTLFCRSLLLRSLCSPHRLWPSAAAAAAAMSRLAGNFPLQAALFNDTQGGQETPQHATFKPQKSGANKPESKKPQTARQSRRRAAAELRRRLFAELVCDEFKSSRSHAHTTCSIPLCAWFATEFVILLQSAGLSHCL